MWYFTFVGNACMTRPNVTKVQGQSAERRRDMTEAGGRGTAFELSLGVPKSRLC